MPWTRYEWLLARQEEMKTRIVERRHRRKSKIATVLHKNPEMTYREAAEDLNCFCSFHGTRKVDTSTGQMYCRLCKKMDWFMKVQSRSAAHVDIQWKCVSAT